MAKINIKWIDDYVSGASSLADNTSILTDIAGFNVDGKDSFQGILKAKINASVSLFETFNITGDYNGSNWFISIDSVTSDSSKIELEITSLGQVQYKSSTYAGFVSGEFIFKVLTT